MLKKLTLTALLAAASTLIAGTETGVTISDKHTSFMDAATPYKEYSNIGRNPGTGQQTIYKTYTRQAALTSDVADKLGVDKTAEHKARFKSSDARTLKDGSVVHTEKQSISVRKDGVLTEAQKEQIKTDLTAGNRVEDKNRVTFKEHTLKNGTTYTTVKIANYKRVTH